MRTELTPLVAKTGETISNKEIERLLNLDVFEDRHLREASCDMSGDEIMIRFAESVKSPVGKIGWFYNWKSQRFLTQTKHVFTSYLLTLEAGGGWCCQCALSSSKFEIESLRSFKKRQQELKKQPDQCVEAGDSPKRVKMSQSPANQPGNSNCSPTPIMPLQWSRSTVSAPLPGSAAQRCVALPDSNLIQQPSLIQRQQQTVGAMDNLISIFEDLSFDQSQLDSFVQSLLVTGLETGAGEGGGMVDDFGASGDMKAAYGTTYGTTAELLIDRFGADADGGGDVRNSLDAEMNSADYNSIEGIEEGIVCTNFIWADTHFNIHERQRIEELFWEIKSNSGPAFKSFASEVDHFVEQHSDFLSRAFTVVNQKDMDITMQAQLRTLYQSFVNLSMQHISQKLSAPDGAGHSESMVQKLSLAVQRNEEQTRCTISATATGELPEGPGVADGAADGVASGAADGAADGENPESIPNGGARLSFLAFIAEVSQQTNRGGLFSELHDEPLHFDDPKKQEAEFFGSPVDSAWDFADKSNSGKMDEFLKICGFPWLIRKLTVYVLSKVRITVTNDQVEMVYRSVFSTHASSHARRCTSLTPGGWSRWKYTEIPRIETNLLSNTHKMNVLFTRAMMKRDVIHVQALRMDYQHIHPPTQNQAKATKIFSFSMLSKVKAEGSNKGAQEPSPQQTTNEWFAKVRTTDVDETGLPKDLDKKCWQLVCEDWKKDDSDPQCNTMHLDIHAYNYSDESGYWTESLAQTNLKCVRGK
jgi:hypothetical protein